LKEGKERLEEERDWKEWLTLEIMEVKKEVKKKKDWWLNIKKIKKKCEGKLKERKEKKEKRIEMKNMVENNGNLKGKKKERKEGEKIEREEQVEWKELWWEKEQVWQEKFENKKRLESRSRKRRIKKRGGRNEFRIAWKGKWKNEFG